MNIKNISLIENILGLKKKHKMSQLPNKKVDEVSLSSLALRKSKELSDRKVTNILKSTPDVRKYKVEEIKAKIKSDTYIKNISSVEIAEKILSSPFSISFSFTKPDFRKAGEHK